MEPLNRVTRSCNNIKSSHFAALDLPKPRASVLGVEPDQREVSDPAATLQGSLEFVTQAVDLACFDQAR